MANRSRSRPVAIRLVGLAVCLPLLTGQGCPSFLPSPGVVSDEGAAGSQAPQGGATQAPVTFARPLSTVIVQVGQTIPVQFDVAWGDFEYELFLDTNTVPADGVRAVTEAGQAVRSQPNSGAALTTVTTGVSTAGLEPGEYMLGVTVVSGDKRLTTYASAVVSLVTGPTVRILFPNGGESAPVGSLVDIRFFASSPTDLNPLVQVFFDTNNDPAGGRVNIGSPVRAREGGIRWDTTGRATGSYYVGAELVDASPAVRDYSDGPITLTPPGSGSGGGGGPAPGPGDEAEVIVTVTTPRTDTTILASQVYAIRWSTNLLPGDGSVRIFREPDHDDDGVPDGQASRVFIGPAGIDAAQQIYQWDTTGIRGTFFIGITCTPLVGDPVEAYSQGRLTIQATSFWLGGLGTERDEDNVVVAQSGVLQGAIFRGYNFQDNLGSAMLAADDYDGDGLNEIVLAAQFGKPFPQWSDDGRGAGEAYLIYGRRTRFSGDIEVNGVGTATVPGVVFPGIMPNPRAVRDGGGAQDPRACSLAFYRDELGFVRVADRYATQGLRSLTLIPDQDNDGKQEIVFGFPWCNSYSLAWQAADGLHPFPAAGIGRLENNGHFLRGGVVIVSSRNSVMTSRTAVSVNGDRALRLGDVGQLFETMSIHPVPPGYPVTEDRCPGKVAAAAGGDAQAETATFPCEGFYQDTRVDISPLRLADPIPAFGLVIPGGVGCEIQGTGLSLNQIDPPPTFSVNFDWLGAFIPARYLWTTNLQDFCGTDPTYVAGQWPPFGSMVTLGTGFYGTGTNCENFRISDPLEPYGCRILGQETTQQQAATTANRFGLSISVSGNVLLIGAPLRSVSRADWEDLPEPQRQESGCVYAMALKRRNSPASSFPWSYRLPPPSEPPQGGDPPPTAMMHANNPAPHNWIIRDVGSTPRIVGGSCSLRSDVIDGPRFSVRRPGLVIGAAPGDQVGEVTGLRDLNADLIEDFAIGAPGTNAGRGAVYVVYRRHLEIEGRVLDLQRVQLATQNPDRLNGFMIRGEVNENLGTAIAGGGPARLNDDYNADTFADLIVGAPNAGTSAGFQSGRVVIVFGGKTLLNEAGGTTLNQLIQAGDAMQLIGTEAGNRTGETVANAGDINGDGIADLAIAAPMAGPPATVRRMFDSDYDGTLDAPGIDLNGDGEADDLDDDGRPDNMAECGVVYVVFGGRHLKGTISLSQIGTANLPGLVFMGRRGGDHLGGGHTLTGELARGISRAGDLDGDGRDDLLISAIEADPEGKTNAGEVYLVYGFGL